MNETAKRIDTGLAGLTSKNPGRALPVVLEQRSGQECPLVHGLVFFRPCLPCRLTGTVSRIVALGEDRHHLKGDVMATKIFVNLPVTDLEAIRRILRQLGYKVNPQFTDETAACLIVSDDIYVMPLTQGEVQGVHAQGNLRRRRRARRCWCVCRAKVATRSTAWSAKLSPAAGRRMPHPKDHGFMYQHGFQDPDGHIWELIHMEPSAIKQG